MAKHATAIVDIETFHASVKAGNLRARTAVRLAPMADAMAATAVERIVTFVFSDDSVDRYGDTIDAKGWDLRAYEGNPVVLYGHDASEPSKIIGKAHNVRIVGNRLLGDIEFASAAENPDAEIVYRLVKGGYLNAVSVGFQPIEWVLTKDKSRPGGIDFKKQALLEVSVVGVPANENALALARAAGIDVDRLKIAPSSAIITSPAAPDLAKRRAAFAAAKKGLFEVGWLADLLSSLDYLCDMVEWETEAEGDGSAIAGRIAAILAALGQVLVDMTAEEVAEMIGEEGSADGDAMTMAAKTPAQKALAFLAQAKSGVSRETFDSLAALIRKCATTTKAGKVLSKANAELLTKAMDHHGQMGDCIKSVLDQMDEGDPCDPEDPAYDPDMCDEATRAAEAAKTAAARQSAKDFLSNL